MRTWENDVSVEFTVRIPAGVRLAARTVNGSVEASSLQSDVEARSVNGRIALSTTGIASAQTVNGSIDASLGQRVWTEPLRFNTVNGSIDLNLPSGIDADLRAETLNGGVSSDFPITIRGWQRRRRIAGTIGNGGRELDLHTVNGSIRLRSTQ
jgi:DUF4097 and DUF4098 domain-containing protein YvlB